MSTEVLDVRVTTNQADVSGEHCYVEKKIRTVSRVHVQRNSNGIAVFGFGALLEMVASVLGWAVESPLSRQEQWVYGGLAVDGLVASMYVLLRDDETSTSDDWQQTPTIAPCNRARGEVSAISNADQDAR